MMQKTTVVNILGMMSSITANCQLAAVYLQSNN